LQNFVRWLKTSSLTRYILIGGSAFVLDFSLLRLGLWLGWHLLIANGLAVTAGLIYSFILHRSFTFAHRAKGSGYQMRGRHQLAIFLSVSLASIALSELIIFLLVHRAGLLPSPAKVVTSALLFVWNYTFNRLLTFRAKP